MKTEKSRRGKKKSQSTNLNYFFFSQQYNPITTVSINVGIPTNIYCACKSQRLSSMASNGIR